MDNFQKTRLFERDLIFGKKDVALKLSNTTQSNSSTLPGNKNFDLGSPSDNQRTKNIVKMGKT